MQDSESRDGTLRRQSCTISTTSSMACRHMTYAYAPEAGCVRASRPWRLTINETGPELGQTNWQPVNRPRCRRGLVAAVPQPGPFIGWEHGCNGVLARYRTPPPTLPHLGSINSPSIPSIHPTLPLSSPLGEGRALLLVDRDKGGPLTHAACSGIIGRGGAADFKAALGCPLTEHPGASHPRWLGASKHHHRLARKHTCTRLAMDEQTTEHGF